jgi:acetylornithine/N-succinyldiaminopimelate aminotransferase
LTGLRERWERAMVPNYATPAILLQRGRGARVEDQEGRTYVDLMAGVAVNALGHAHPAVVAAVTRQAQTLAHTSNLYANAPALLLAERLQAVAGGHQCLLVNSGTEANEAALKLARRHAHAQGAPDAVVLAFTDSFHGRTTGALALTGQPHYQEGFQPLPGQVVHVPLNDPSALEAAFARHRVAAVFFEAIQGEGGVTPMTQECADAMARLAAGQGALLVADEVQTGVGRTGAFFGHEHLRLRPDVITMAKGVGGGLPLGAMLARPDVARVLGPGSHGCTFGGNPIACAAGNAVLDVIATQGLMPRAARLGRQFQDDLGRAGIASRGRGLLLGVPLAGPHAPDVVAAMRAAGYLAGQAGKSVVRLAPPLVIEDGDWLGAVAPLAAAVAPHVPPSPVPA